MNKIRALQIIVDIRSGLEEDQVMAKYRLSRKGLERALKRLVNDGLMSHEELYRRSRAYRRIADILAARQSPRFYVPIALRVCRHETSHNGFIRDISDHGVRVAGIPANVGDKILFDLPLTEIDGTTPLQFEAECRWVRMEGRKAKYPVGGFEITNISQDSRIQFEEVRDAILSQTIGEERRLYTPLRPPDMGDPGGDIRTETGSNGFSGVVENLDILDFVQFILLTRRKAVVDIYSSSGEEGQLYVEGGRIVHAIAGETHGKQAFFECMGFEGGEVATKPWHEPGERSINVPGDYLLMEAARIRDERSDEIEHSED